MFCTAMHLLGGKFLGYKVCSLKCVREIRWKDTLSLMNKEYYPDPDPYVEPPQDWKFCVKCNQNFRISLGHTCSDDVKPNETKNPNDS